MYYLHSVALSKKRFLKLLLLTVAGKKKKGPPPPPPVGPWLRKIHLADNSIDHLQPGGGSACLQCIREFRRQVIV